ncbi:neuromodulin isoform X4 [Apis laboriosa]|uniref:neuromodulin isoform X4 n=1 Tax=Apis laboriosa TaxID=183418 RepID=UPI001CC53572|nr:neuromodulin isoform X4 [Apis laboriosa]
MGCNTSKESVQPVGDEAKEDGKNGDITKGESSPAKVDSQESSQKRQSADSKERKEGEKKEEDTEKEREKAATRIQAAFRGHHARKSMKDIESSTKQTGTKSNSEPTKEQLQQEFRADDKELCEAATKIQASFRGHMSRKEQAAAAIAKSAENAVEDVVSKMEEKISENQNSSTDHRSSVAANLLPGRV